MFIGISSIYYCKDFNFEVLLQIIAILVGVLEIYSKKVNNKDYQEGNFIILALAIFYSRNSEERIVSYLLLIIYYYDSFLIDRVIEMRYKNEEN